MGRRASLTIVAFFVAFISMPLVLLVSGVRTDAIENRAQASIDPPTTGSIADATWFERFDQVLLDWLPLRPEAVTVDAWIDLFVLRDSPTFRVVIGDEGWLFLDQTLLNPCLTDDDLAVLAAEVDAAGRVAAAAGKDLRLLIAPDKASIYPQHVPVGRADCVTHNADAMGSLGADHLVPVWEALREARGDERTFFRLNTHWTTFGAGAAAEVLLGSLRPGLWEPEAFQVRGTGRIVGDLTRIQGLVRSEVERLYVARREVPTYGPRTARLYAPDGRELRSMPAIAFRTPRGAAIAGRTLMLHDSFGYALGKGLQPYFRDITMIREPDPANGVLAPYLAEADTIILESVQRAVFERWATGRLSEHLATGLAASLPLAPVRAATGPDGVFVPGASDGTLRFAVVRGEGGTDASFVIPGRDEAFSLTAMFPVRAIAVPAEGLTIAPTQGLLTVEVVEAP